MDADAAVNLIVQPDLAIRHVVVAAQLNAIHAEVRVLEARLADQIGQQVETTAQTCRSEIREQVE